MTSPIDNSLVSSGIQAYITLDSFVKILNKYILLYAGNNLISKKPFIEISVKPNAYYTGSLPADEQDSLLCLAHPLQVSVDPTVCLITNPLWAKGFDTSEFADGINNGAPTLYDDAARDIYNQLEKIGAGNEDPIGAALLKYIEYGQPNYSPNNAKEFVRAFAKYAKSILPTISNGGILEKLKALQRGNNVNLETSDPTYQILFSEQTITDVVNEDKEKVATAEKLAKGENPYGIDYLNDLQKGKKFDFKDELGKIGNIYLNLDMLYRLAIDPSLYDKNELKLYQYLKKVLYEVQTSIGSVNNFDIHVDPIDNVARIIDLNYIDTTARNEINDPSKDKIFQIEMSNTSGSVRSYNLQSQIFPEQGAMIAIGAQVSSANNQATSANTLLDFNNNLEDRIIPKKINPPASISPTTGSLVTNLVDSFNKIKQFLIPDTTKIKQANGTETIVYPSTSEYKTSLKDIISYFQTYFYSNTKNRSIIPIKLSLTIDGIGGLVIGHLFKIPPDLLPKGYKSDTVGGKLVQIIVGLGHKIENGDWTTTIDAYNIVTSNPTGPKQNFRDFIVIDPKTGQQQITLKPNSTNPYENVSAAVKFFTNKGYKDYQVAAIVGALIAESNLLPTSSLTDSTGSTLGIAQWRGPRQAALKQKSGFDTLNVQLSFIIEEFTAGDVLEVKAGRALSNSSTFGDAVVAMAMYERFYGKGYNVTFENLSRDYSRRVQLSQDILTRIQTKEFIQAPLTTNLNTFN
jgi:hypothetical protein